MVLLQRLGWGTHASSPAMGRAMSFAEWQMRPAQDLAAA